MTLSTQARQHSSDAETTPGISIKARTAWEDLQRWLEKHHRMQVCKAYGSVNPRRLETVTAAKGAPSKLWTIRRRTSAWDRGPSWLKQTGAIYSPFFYSAIRFWLITSSEYQWFPVSELLRRKNLILENDSFLVLALLCFPLHDLSPTRLDKKSGCVCKASGSITVIHHQYLERMSLATACIWPHLHTGYVNK